jgi:hypothetical protein
MRQNAQECTSMRKNAFECTGLWNHTHILTQEKPSGLKAKLTCGRNGYGLDGLWACPWSTHVPLHVIQVFIRLLSVPFLFDCVISRLDASPSNYVARTVCADSAPGHLLKESLQVDPVQGSPASHALSISDKQGCDCYSVGAIARDLCVCQHSAHASHPRASRAMSISSNAMQLSKHKMELLNAALELYKGNRLDPGYVKAEADAEKMWSKEMAKLRKREREASGKPLSATLPTECSLCGEAYKCI